ncbi:MAG: cold shock domain-containing protein [Rubripirellula sp.]|jgi:cold shock CspA family protein|nr:cold shock domain-containing protein [Rubripirellula sp.]MDA8696940.1 cold shock domain-containing protein [Rhodopirellula sp.]
MPMPSDEPPELNKKFRIQRRRLGKVKFLAEKGDYGFITAEDYKEDVFFHMSTWKPDSATLGESSAVELIEGLWVEFELDDDQFEEDKRLRAKIVRPTMRPIGRKLSGRDATFQIITHHPKARKRRPSWRDTQE